MALLLVDFLDFISANPSCKPRRTNYLMQTNLFSPCSKMLCIKVTCLFVCFLLRQNATGNYLENSLNSQLCFDCSGLVFNYGYTVLPVQTLVLNWPINKITKWVWLAQTSHPTPHLSLPLYQPGLDSIGHLFAWIYWTDHLACHYRALVFLLFLWLSVFVSYLAARSRLFTLW